MAQKAERIANRVDLAEELALVESMRPKRREDCHKVRLQLVADLPEDSAYKQRRPCPFISCRFHLHADVSTAGVITLMDGDIAQTCVLDIIDEHPDGVSREEIADILRVTAERTRFFERRMEKKMRAMGSLEEWRGHECTTTESALSAAMES